MVEWFRKSKIRQCSLAGSGWTRPAKLPVLGGFDSSPNAMAQGPTRRARGEAFLKYVNDVLGAKHNAIIVPECGHNDRCIYTTDLVFPVIFPR